MPTQRKSQRIVKLTQKLSDLKKQKDRINTEAAKWAKKRDNLNQQSKGLRAEISRLRTMRDILNNEVQKLKQRRGKASDEVREKIEEIKRLRSETANYEKKKPLKSSQLLAKELENLEWRIQTTPSSLQEDKELIQEVKRLGTQLGIHDKLERLNQKILELQTEIKASEVNNAALHRKLVDNAQKSQEIHKEMLEKIKKSKQLEAEADSFHMLFVQTRKTIKPIQDEFVIVSKQIKQLKDAIREEEEKAKKKTKEFLKKKIQKRVREKLKCGEKLSWEEFQVLVEKDIGTQNKSRTRINNREEKVE